MTTELTCKDLSGLGNYQYLVYAILGAGCIGSEALGLTKYVKPNTIIEVVIAGAKMLFGGKNTQTKELEEVKVDVQPATLPSPTSKNKVAPENDIEPNSSIEQNKAANSPI